MTYKEIEEDLKIYKKMGERIRQLRLSNGWSREQVCRHLGVSTQQLKKYEDGTNKISVGRLTLIAKAFDRPLYYFYDEHKSNNSFPNIESKIGVDVYSNFIKLKSIKLQRSIGNLLRVLVSEQNNES